MVRSEKDVCPSAAWRCSDIEEMTWVFPKMVVPLNHPWINRVFHYQPSILGYHYFWKHPCASNFWTFRILLTSVCWQRLQMFRAKTKRTWLASCFPWGLSWWASEWQYSHSSLAWEGHETFEFFKVYFWLVSFFKIDFASNIQLPQFKMAFWPPSWRSLIFSKGYLTISKKVTSTIAR